MAMAYIGLSSLQAQSVEFAPVGAGWYYGKYFREGVNPTGNTYDYFKSLREVEVNGWMCKEVEKSWHSDCNGNYNPQTEIHYLCQEGEQVYEVENGERFLLYDFSKNVGDFWVMPKYEDTVLVDEITSITLSDGSSSEQACDYEDALSVEENDDTKRISTFPNPVKNQFQMQLPAGTECASVQLYNLQGRLLTDILLHYYSGATVKEIYN